MKKRFIPTIIALVVLILLGIYSNYYEVDEILPPGEVKPVSILPFKDNDIKSISYGKDGKFDLKVEISSQSSKIVSPSNYRSDDAEVFGVIRHFTELKSENIISDNVTDTSLFGISSGSPSIKFETLNNTIEISMGNDVPIGNSIYVKKKDDSNIYVVPSHIKGSFNKKLTDLRDRALYYEDFGKCNEINYSYRTQNVKLVLDSKNSEWLIADSKYSADNEEVANLINNMRNLRISDFEDGTDLNNEKYGLATPTLYIRMKNEYGKVYELKSGLMQGSDTYVSSDGITVQKVNSLKIQDLMLTYNDFRDKFLDIFSYKDVTEIELSDASGTIKLNKNEKKWVKNEINLNESDIKDFINSISRTKVSEYAEKQDLENLGLDQPEKCRKISLKSNDKIKTFWLGTSKGVVLYIMDENEMMQVNTDFENLFNNFVHKMRNAEIKVDK